MDYVISILHALTKYGSGIRSIAKVVLHTITGKCELERLSLSGKYGYAECQEVEYSLYYSRNDDIRRLLVADSVKIKDALQTILRVKRIIPDENKLFLTSMPRFLRKIISYNALVATVDGLRTTTYQEDNEEHEEKLNTLWTLIKGNADPLTERHTTRWTEIGFQGKNPATDFRGMGILGLENLLHLFEKEHTVGLKVFGQSQHPEYGFSFAIMAINFTNTSFQLLRNGKLKGYFYELNAVEYGLQDYQDFFMSLFNEFADYWVMRKPANIMAFNEIKGTFMADVEKRLSSGKW